MAVKIRLSRGGAKKKPYYRIVVANNTAPRDGDFLEKVGTYNPMLEGKDKNRVALVKDRIDYWLSKGAKPTDRVAKFLEAEGIKLPEHIKKEMAIKVKSRVNRKSKKEQPEEEAPAPAAVDTPVAEAAPAEEAKVEEKPAEEASQEESKE